ncbi:MAG: hypothetical protein P8076_01460 [Gammaproteobacteria bacterium]
MPEAARHLTLLIPSLPEPLAASSTGWQPPDRAPALETLVARARREPGGGPAALETLLFGQFGLRPRPDRDLPVAAATRAGDCGTVDNGWWLRVDPVHLRPDQDRLLLFGPSVLDLHQDEADALVAGLNDLYGADGWRFEAPVPQRWYLRLPDEAALVTTPLPEAVGRDIHPRLPDGAHGLHWHAVLNEMQMFLHASEVNQRREAQGRPVVNSVWPWGGGRAPAGLRSPWHRVESSEPLAAGLARIAGAAGGEASADFGAWLGQDWRGRGLVVLDGLRQHVLDGDREGWCNAVSDLEQRWFVPLLEAVRAGRVAEVCLIGGGDLCYCLDRAALRRWWRRPRPLVR